MGLNQQYKGISVREAPTFDAQATEKVIANGTTVYVFENPVVVVHKGKDVNFYQLADGEGYIHDFDQSRKDCRTIRKLRKQVTTSFFQ